LDWTVSNEVMNQYWTDLIMAVERLETEGFFGTYCNRGQLIVMLVGDLPEELIKLSVKKWNSKDVIKAYDDSLPSQ